ncbi:uncharacterized protein BX663DRAFT_434008 [Cokeromyces recurvatus]|uniref:uncharacterized protein n=1 Tax=Cokeromyces recurvatus TaxID=90255 RepID=UPI002220A2F6|nr:uncharacterized protein BX663DRAFT_434008 [Cokeromyces recurvatus]KAI7903200.1 hypothetical protein BX663DRAFT_434008 [Cokeromyces recurvatus]
MSSETGSPLPTTSTTRKRTHLKPSQVAILQESFNINPLPDSSVRSRLARELAVTERTIQIWFQNRRAKARKGELMGPSLSSHVSSLMNRPDWISSSHRLSTPPRYQATFRTMMTPERFEELKHQDQQQQQHQQQNSSIRKRPRSISKPETKSSHLLDIVASHHQENTTRAMSEDLYTTTPIQMVPLPVSVLRIGTWTRFAHSSSLYQRDWDLVCYSSPVDRELVWRIQAEGHFFRIQISFDHIRQLRLSQQIQLETGELVGQLDIELTLPLTFSMWRLGQDEDWVRCGDFTEDKQASVDGFHILQGNHDAFKQALLDLISLSPELATKMCVIPITTTTAAAAAAVDLIQPPPLDLCRDFTMSPSATPEPSSLTATGYVPQPWMMYHGTLPSSYGMINPQQLSTKTNPTMSHLMLQAPFFYPSTQTNTENEDLYQLLLQQDQQQQQSIIFPPSILM